MHKNIPNCKGYGLWRYLKILNYIKGIKIMTFLKLEILSKLKSNKMSTKLNNFSSTVYGVQCTVWCTVYGVQCIVWWTVYGVQFTMYGVQCTVYSVQCGVRCTVYSLLCTVFSVRCTVYGTLVHDYQDESGGRGRDKKHWSRSPTLKSRVSDHI